MYKGLVRKYKGLFTVLKRVGKVSYRLELPSKLKIHLVFYVSILKPYKAERKTHLEVSHTVPQQWW